MFLNVGEAVQKFIPFIPSLDSGIAVADLGCGEGSYTIQLAKRMNNQGRLYAVDVQKSLLDRLGSQLESLEISNTTLIWSDLEVIQATKIPDSSLDVVLIANTLFQIDEVDKFAEEINRMLKPGGVILIIDWSDTFGGLGPQPDHLFDKTKASNWCQSNNFLIQHELVIGPHHYGIVATKQ